jgi:Ser/Thr protein kinase RdoA (MazF antagonist)
MLDVDNAVPFLLAHGLIQRDWILSGDLTIKSAARRNRNLRVEGPGGAGCFIKQPDSLVSAGRQTLASEAAFYEFCQEEAAALSVARLIPRLVFREPDRSLHVLELIPGAIPLSRYASDRLPDAFPVEPSRALGQGLGTLHRCFRMPGLASDPRLAPMNRLPPPVFRSHRVSPAMLADLSPAGVLVFRMIREQADLLESIARLAEKWQTETVIHGDLKSDNVLVGPQQSPDSEHRAIWLVDWEFVQKGDPAWDLAGLLHDFLLLWTSSMPLEPDLPAEEMINQARCPLDLLRPAIRAFWSGYLLTAALGHHSADSLLNRAVEFSAVRLVLAAHELSYEQDELSVQVVLLIQLAANLVADPEPACTQLYGIFRESGPR